MRFPTTRLGWTCAALIVMACSNEPPAVVLGPADGRELPPADTGRVVVGAPAPDFTLASFAGEPVRLSQFRGSKDVVLVFYRGHW